MRTTPTILVGRRSAIQATLCVRPAPCIARDFGLAEFAPCPIPLPENGLLHSNDKLGDQEITFLLEPFPLLPHPPPQMALVQVVPQTMNPSSTRTSSFAGWRSSA